MSFWEKGQQGYLGWNKRRQERIQGVMDWAPAAPYIPGGPQFARGVRYHQNKKRKGYGSVGTRSRSLRGSQTRNSLYAVKKTFKGSRKGKPRGKRVGKGANKAPWFKNIMKSNTPAQVAGQYTNQITITTNQKTAVSHWHGLSIIDMDNVAQENINATSAGTGGTGLSNKVYIYDLVRRHQWRNNADNCAVHVTAYILYARRDFPSYASTLAGGLINTATITPPSSNVATTGGSLINPGMWVQWFVDTSAGGQFGTKVLYTDPATTPYMNPQITAMFKIKPLQMIFPDGKKAQGILEPGQTIRYVGKRSKPIATHYGAYGLNAGSTYTFGRTYEVFKHTPVIFLQIKGTAVHDDTTNALVGLGKGVLDYVQDFSYKYIGAQVQSVKTFNPITSASTITDPRQTDVATGVAANQGET